MSRNRLAVTLLAALSLSLPFHGAAGERDHGRQHGAEMDHSQHHVPAGYVRSEHAYKTPEVNLVGADGAAVSLATALDGDQPVMLNFIFTTCTTICPVATATFAQARTQLGPERDKVKLVSITIDPEHDTPAQLRTYAAKFSTGANWSFLTGTLTDIIKVQNGFDVYRGGKAAHLPLTFLRAARGAPWVRLEGLTSAQDLVREYRTLAVK